MSKYNTLWIYIKENDIKNLTFEEIKKILGFEIDHSFLNYKKELLEYSYEVKKIHLKDKYIEFIKR